MNASKNEIVPRTPASTSEAEDTYCYKELPNAHSIRLITLLPGIGNNKLECFIHFATIDDKPQYETLSYVWGSPTPTEEIGCSGKVMFVTLSLKIALRRFRLQTAPRILWIDQLCIDQSNDMEKSHQVKMMWEIYAMATKTLVWLGLDDQNAAIDAWILVYKITNLQPDLPCLSGLFFPTDDVLVSSGLPYRSSPQWNALKKLFDLPYFHRMWIIQELILSSETEIQWGGVEFTWESLKATMKWLKSNKCEYGQSKAINIQGAMVATLDFWLLDIDQALHLTRKHRTSEPRDRVFALLRVVSDVYESDFVEDPAHQHELEVDYSKTIVGVFTDVTKRIMRTRRTLRPLTDVNHSHVSNTSDWPTWVPQWKEDASSMLRHISPFHNIYMACGETQIDLDSLEHGPLLSLEGLRIGKTESWFLFDEKGESPLQNGGNVSEAWSFAVSYFPDTYHGKPLIQAFIWTLTGGTTITAGDQIGTPADNSTLVDFVAFFTKWIARTLAILPDDFGAPNFPLCLRSKLDPAEKALALLQQLQPPNPKTRKFPSQALAQMEPSILDAVSSYHSNYSFKESSEWDTFKNLLALSGGADRFEGCFVRNASCRKLFLTKEGYIGMGPQAMKTGDIICVMFGGQTPYALRPTDLGEFLFVGECYMYDYTNGEAIEYWREGKLISEKFMIR